MPAAIVILQLVAQYGPIWVGKMIDLIHSDKEPTAEDWHKLLAQASGKSYDDYLAEATKR